MKRFKNYLRTKNIRCFNILQSSSEEILVWKCKRTFLIYSYICFKMWNVPTYYISVYRVRKECPNTVINTPFTINQMSQLNKLFVLLWYFSAVVINNCE
jgi:hypothetical protein